jgi:DNA modification methylase
MVAMELDNIIQGDALEVLKTLPSESVDCCITSPPYYGLRDYGTANWVGGDEKCNHLKGDGSPKSRAKSTIGYAESTGHNLESWGDVCQKCGAIRQDKQIGLEGSPEEYVNKLVEIFREVKRVLKDNGTLWLNLGDSYWGSNQGYGQKEKSATGFQFVGSGQYASSKDRVPQSYKHPNLKPKDLIGIPWRVAFALQEDGWWLRQDIIWHKPNSMPESVTDRCTKSHEYIFLLAKSQIYYFDNEAIREPYTQPINRYGGQKLKANGKSEWDKGTGQQTYRERDMRPDDKGRNKRSVWTVITKPFKEAHFATFPEDLIEPMIKAGTSKGGCVLDIFMGAGTTAVVSKKLGRHYIGIELNPKYVEIAEKRINRVPIRLDMLKF